MFTPHQHHDEPIHGLRTVNHTTNAESASSSGITTEDYGPGADFENIIQTSANAPLAVEPMTPYQSMLRREVETLFGTANPAPVAALAPPIYTTPVTEGAEAAQFSEAHPHTTTTQTVHSCLATVPCRWTGGVDNSETCDALITCKSVPAHFGDTHGTRKLGRDALIYCRWEGCYKQVTRKNFVRHIRECHLNRHPR